MTLEDPAGALDDSLLAELARLADAATPGPWITGTGGELLSIEPGEIARFRAYCAAQRHGIGDKRRCTCPGCTGTGAIVGESMKRPDATFAAVARSAVPLLVSEVLTLRKLVGKLRELEKTR